MKKFLALICMITCIFGLTACGSEETLTEYEQSKVTYAQEYAAQQIVPFMLNFMDDANLNVYAENTAEEIESVFETNYQMLVDGYAIKNGIISFNSAADSIGAVDSVGQATAEIDDKQIIVQVEVFGELKDAKAEVILSNDMFMRLESVSLNPVFSMGELMGNAALNTVVGMGIVFAVLILISLIISCLGVIPKIQAKLSKKNREEEAPAPVSAPVAAAAEEVEESDDLELVAVIAAAIAASEGRTSTDGFVVRSIRKVNRSRR